LIRPLTKEGKESCRLVTAYLKDKQIDAVFSSPYKRAVDTVKDFADQFHLPIITMEDFRERKIDNGWITDYSGYVEKQWQDFSYKLEGGESLQEVQDRNISAINRLLEEYRDKNIVIGSHGVAASTVMNYYDSTFGYQQFNSIIDKMPFIIKLDFRGKECRSIEMSDLV
jgi:2,3-bisphosphoglycerate-dependent phosphoglycerate mutase